MRQLFRVILSAVFVLISIHTLHSKELKASAYRQEMRRFVQKISAAAKAINPEFLVVPHNSENIVTSRDNPNEPFDETYLQAIDGIGREGLFYGYDQDGEATASRVTRRLGTFLDEYAAQGLKVLVVDYAFMPNKVADSYIRNDSRGYIAFVTTDRLLDRIPRYPGRPFHENMTDILSLSQARNFLLLSHPQNEEIFANKDAYLAALQRTNFDLLIVDASYGGDFLTTFEVNSLKNKRNGAQRLLMARMNVGEAERDRYYWRSEWNSLRPDWMVREDPDLSGAFTVEYWRPEWQSIVLHGKDSYLNKILRSGFDGVYLEGVDAFEFFETEINQDPTF